MTTQTQTLELWFSLSLLPLEAYLKEAILSNVTGQESLTLARAGHVNTNERKAKYYVKAIIIRLGL